MKTVLSIAGSDCSGGAGIQADIKTMTMHGVFAMSAITALTAQNTTGVFAVSEISPSFLQSQIDAVFEDIVPDAVKIGMVPSPELIEIIADRLSFYRAKNIVIDPVMISTSGLRLAKKEAIDAMKRRLFSIADVVTPNLPEAEALIGTSVCCRNDMEKAAAAISQTYGCAVLCKGGHLADGADDLLYADGASVWLSGSKIPNPNTHGTGCTLSSALASNLAKGFSLQEAAKLAKAYVFEALSCILELGKGNGPLNHAFDLNSRFSKEQNNSHFFQKGDSYEKL